MRAALVLVIAAAVAWAAWRVDPHLWWLPALLVNAVVLLHLALVTIRRVALTVSALWGADDALPPLADPPPRLAVLIPCRDEATALPASLRAWELVHYPPDRLRLVLIDDSSRDATSALLREYAAVHANALVVTRTDAAGSKGAALQDALTHVGPADAVAVFDADARPAPECLHRLAAHLADPAVAAVAGRMLPVDAPGRAAVYAAIEAAVHQRLTVTGAARSGGTVPLLGSAYLVRREALVRAGFAIDHRLEDIDLTARLLRRGLHVAWEPRATCAHLPAATTHDLAAQRRAWSRGFHRVARDHARALVASAPTIAVGLDRLVFCLAYLDRVSLLLAVALAAAASAGSPLWMPWSLVAVFAAAPLLQIPLALYAEAWPARRWLRAVTALALVPVDFLAELAAFPADLLGRPLRWRATARADERREP